MAFQYRRHLGSTARSVPVGSAEIYVATNPDAGVTGCTILVALRLWHNSASGFGDCGTIEDTKGNVYVLEAQERVGGESSRHGLYLFACRAAAPLEDSEVIMWAAGDVSPLRMAILADEATGIGTDAPTVETKAVAEASGNSEQVTTDDIDLDAQEYFAYVVGGRVSQQSITSEALSVLDPSEIQQFNAGGIVGTVEMDGDDTTVRSGYHIVINTPGDYQGDLLTSGDETDKAVILAIYSGSDALLKATGVAVARGEGAIRWLAAAGVAVARGTADMQPLRAAGVAVANGTGRLNEPTVTLTGAAGLFTRIGHIGGFLNTINTHRGPTALAHNVTIEGDYPSNAQPELADGLWSNFAGYQAGHSSFTGTLQALAESVVITTMVSNADLPDERLETALIELIDQMDRQLDSVSQATVAVAWSADTANSGNAVLVLSTTGLTGLTRRNLLQETLTLTCDADVVAGATEGEESLALVGEIEEGDALSHDWPAGSGAAASLTAVSPAGGVTLLANGDFETWSAGATPVLSDWTIGVGTNGLHVKKETSSLYAGSAALQFFGADSSTLTAVYQTLAAANGNELRPFTQYAFNAWIKAAGIFEPGGQGVLRFALKQPDGTTIVADAAGTPNAVTFSLPGGVYEDDFVQVSGSFRTPETVSGVLTSTDVRFYVELSTALNVGASVVIDHLTFSEMTEMYPGGPFLTVCAGSDRLVTGDKFTIDVTNGATVATFQRLFDRLFGMRDLGLQLPSSGSPTISDNLIV